jgi:hypothetical protein
VAPAGIAEFCAWEVFTIACAAATKATAWLAEFISGLTEFCPCDAELF